MFINNKYTKWYFNIIESAKQARPAFTRKYRKDYPFYELHHIIPRSMNGDNTKENLVLLSPREHFVCHVLLTRMVTGPNKYKMAAAVMAFNKNMTNQKQHRQVYCNSRLYEALRFEAGKHKQQIHTGLAKPKTEEHKRKLSEQMKRLFAEGCIDMNRYEKAKRSHACLVWIHKDEKNKRVNQSLVEGFILDGWTRGRYMGHITADFRAKLSQAITLAWKEGRKV